MEQNNKRLIKRSLYVCCVLMLLVYNNDSVLSQIVDDFQVTEKTDDSDKFLSSIAVDDSGKFIITWVDILGWDFTVLAKRFMNDGTVIDSGFIVCEEDTPLMFNPFRVVVVMD